MFRKEVATRRFLFFHNRPAHPVTLLTGLEPEDELSLTLFFEVLW
jgi:hypothetical protein